MAIAAERKPIEVGQIYESLDYREKGRLVEVVAISPLFVQVKNIKTQRQTYIAVRRFRPIHNGFRLVVGSDNIN